MPYLLRRTCRDLACNTRGSEIAETAMIIPLFFMIFLAIFWFGQSFRIYGILTHATREGAEAAVTPVCGLCTAGATPAANAQAAVYSAFAAAHLDKSGLVAWSKWTPPALNACGVATPKGCDGTVADVCVQANVQLSKASQGGMGSCGVSVSARYKYGHSLPIPFTSLDLGNIMLPGQSQMRLETQ